MNKQTITFAALYTLGAIAILWTVYTLLTSGDVWTDPLYSASDQAVLVLNSLFWLAIGAALIFATRKRSHWVSAVLLIALLYIVVSCVMHVAPLAQFYLFNTSGLSGYRILAVVAAPCAAQIAILVALLFATRRLRQAGHLS
ncbi:hypothetical protein [Amylibacter sp. IMCC11727]|uniref:hypothetical protein n=1 Tax=Amylibacter sp. IMCC11727 TaxID=3039851 RepID=UPI00244DE49C|nr:hypothetical protein [Amylibacter sp. IMCC11727]WGI23447.1 hypothetical protein QBD29_08470 [Amylibacter sp. IMCC11727]